MYVLRRHLAAFAALAGAAVLFAALPTRAAPGWVETRVTGHAATVDVERNGTATVTQELGIRLRGGPLAELPLAGVDSDAEPLPDATVICTDDQKFGTVPLTATREPDGTLKLTVERDRGLRTLARTSFASKLSHAQLAKRELIRRVGSHVELRWVEAPRFDDGLDSARVTFPHSGSERRLRYCRAPASSSVHGERDATSSAACSSATCAAHLAKTSSRSIRPHVARGEPLRVWRVWVSTDSAFDQFTAGPLPRARPRLASLLRELRVIRRAKALSWLVGALRRAAWFLGSLLLAKWRRGFPALPPRLACRPKLATLCQMAVGVRAALGGVLLGLAVIAGGRWDEPTWVGLLLLGAMACAALYAKPGRPAPRGPGAVAATLRSRRVR